MRLRLKQGRPRGMHLGKERPALNGGRVKNIGPHRRENEVSRLSPKRRLYQKHAFMNILVIRSIIFLRFFDLRRIYIYIHIYARISTREKTDGGKTILIILHSVMMRTQNRKLIKDSLHILRQKVFSHPPSLRYRESPPETNNTSVSLSLSISIPSMD